MRKNFKWLLALVAMVASVNLMAATSKTATYTVASATSLTVANAPEGATFTLTGNAALLDGMLQFTYGKAKTLTLSGYEGCKITGFSMDMKSNSSAGLGSMSIKVGNTTLHSISSKKFNDAAWYGNWSSSSVTIDFTLSSNPTVKEGETIVIEVSNPGTAKSANSIYVGKFSITYEEGDTPSDPIDPTVTFNNGEVKATKTLDLSTLYSSNSTGAVTYSITEGGAYATLAGSILTGVSEGAVTVKASQAAATGYNAKEATATITVTAAPVEVVYSLVTDASKLEEGQKIIIVNSGADKALSSTQNSNNRSAVTVTCVDNKISVEEGSGVQVITLGKAQKDSKNYWTLGVDDGYLYAASSSSNHLKTQTTLDDNGKWNISISDNIASITAQGTNTRNQLKNNGDIFSCYSSGQTAVKIFAASIPPTNEAVTFAAPTGGTLVIKNGATPIATGATIQDGTVLDVEFGMTPAEAYKNVAIKVTNTTTSADVTSTVYNSETQKITMPRYPITVAVTFTKLYKIEAATVTGGTLSWEDANKAKPTYVEAGTYILALQEEATHYEFKSFDIYKTCDATTKVDDVDGLFEMPAYDVTISGTFEEMQCTALPSAPVLVTPTISYAEGVTLNWTKLDAASGYLVNVWKGTDKIVVDEMITDVNTLSYKITAELGINTEYSYSIAGIGDDETYCMIGNPANESTFTTADYPAVVLTLSENGVETPVNDKLNTPIELPTTSTQACDGKVFVGWSENPIEGEVGKDQVNLLGETYTFTDPAVLEKTIYAVYAKETEGATTWNEVSSVANVEVGEYVIINNSFYLPSTTTSSAPSQVAAPTITNNKIADADVTAAMKWNLSDAGEGKFYVKNSGGSYLYETNNNNGLRVGNTSDKWTFITNSTALAMQGTNNSRFCATYKDGSDWRSYTSKDAGGYGDGGNLYLYKKTVAASTYSNCCTTCQAAVVPPIFSLTEESYTSAQTLELTAPEGDIYYTINDGAETKYTAAIALNNRGTYKISAYAKVNERTSETVTKTYTLNWPYTLDELAASDVASGTSVQVTFENKEITGFYTNGQGKRYGIYVNVQKGGKDVEIYCNQAEHPNTWETGGVVSSKQAITGTWTYYSGGSQWEFCPSNWNDINYTAPAKIESLKITGDVTNKNYTAGQKLDFTGLTVTGVYSDATEEDVTEDVVWTEVTLTENQPEATATATLNNAKTGNLPVVQSKTITGLTVGAAKTLESIYVDNEHSTHKKAFFVGRPFSAEGLIVMAHYNMGNDQQIALANLTIDNPTFSAAEAEHTINISYTENEVEKSTSYKVSVGYMNLSDLVAEDIPTNTSVNVAFSDVEITGFYKNKSEQRTGVYVNVKGKNERNIELYSSGTPSETLNGWQEGGKIASKGTYISGTWKYYETNDVWEIDFGSNYAWATNIDYTAPEIYPTKIELYPTEATVKQSKSLDLDANFAPANTTVLNNLEWSSDNNQVTVVPSQDKKSAKVTVAPDATVGTATITVKVDDKDGNKLSATCVITIQEYSVPHYGLYSGAIEGGDYIFKANGQNYYMNNTNNNGRLANVANENNPEIVNNIITTDAESFVWQIAKSGDYWTIQNLENSKYVSSTAKSSAGLVDDATANTALWTITYDATNEVYTFVNLGRSQAASDADKCYLRNNNNSGWACYSSTQSNAITLYKAGFTPAAALQSIEIKGDLEITEYFQGKSVKYDGLTVEGTYSDGDKKTITEGIAWSANPATFTEKGDNISVTITATVQTKNGEITDDANFTVKVVESQKVSYGLVTSVNTLYDGATIILGAVFGTAAAPIYAVNQGFDTKYLAAYRSNTEGSDLEYENEVMKTAYASEITLKKVEGGWKLLGEDGKYINGAGDLSQTTDVAEATVWTISIEDGVTKIASGNNVICYNTSAPRFKTYTETSQTVINCGIYMKNLLPVRTGLTIGQYTTYCEPYAVVAGSYSGATFWNIADKTYMSDNQRLYSITIEQHLGDLEAGVPYIMLPEATQLTGVQYGEAVDAPAAEDAHNGLVGVFEKTMFGSVADDAAAIERGIYIISDGTLYLCGNNCGVYANRAYILRDQIYSTAPTGAPRRVIGNPNGTPTTLNGLNGNKAGKAQKALIDGHIYILRDNKMYNAQGLFVK